MLFLGKVPYPYFSFSQVPPTLADESQEVVLDALCQGCLSFVAKILTCGSIINPVYYLSLETFPTEGCHLCSIMLSHWPFIRSPVPPKADLNRFELGWGISLHAETHTLRISGTRCYYIAAFYNKREHEVPEWPRSFVHLVIIAQ